MMNTPEVHKVTRSYSNKDLEIFDVDHKEKFITCLRTSIYYNDYYNNQFSAGLPKPTKLGFFSIKIDRITGDQKYHGDKSELKYLDLSSNSLYDLNTGYKSLINWCDHKRGLDGFLQWILENLAKLTISQRLKSILNLNTDFVCYRGVLTKILTTPYEKSGDWMLIAIKIGNTIYFHELRTDAQVSQDSVENLRKMSYAGLRFESMICRDSNGLADDDGISLRSGHSGQFCCILRLQINRNSVTYAAEMDCVEKKSQLTDPLSELSFLEVKTTTTIKDRRQYENFHRYKAIKWWAQNYLGNVDKTICGYRDVDLCVRHIYSIETEQLAQNSAYWSPTVCFNFLDNFFNVTKNAVTQEMVCYRIYYSPDEISFSQTELPVESFIPCWYNDGSPSAIDLVNMTKS